jgi:competence protein ComFC
MEMKPLLAIRQIRNFLLDILFPVYCLGCTIKNEILCNNCIQKIQLAERETNKDISAMFDYRDSLARKAIWELKYHRRRYLGERLGELLYEFFIEDISEIKANVPGRAIFLIPVPISNKKNKVRGYNQALVIAKGFCHRAPKGIFELKEKVVVKKIETVSQVKITNRQKRLKNIRGVFEIKNPQIVKGRIIIVIDDVTTTGGTISEIMKILKIAGAKRVIGLTVAH